MASKIAKEVAVQDFEQWLSVKRINATKREEKKDFENIIVDAICDRILVLEKDNVFTMKLPDPVKSDAGADLLSELKFKPRLRVHELNAKLKGVKPEDGDGRILAYISAITGQNSGLISKMFTEDYTLCQAIAMYFL